eukprot:2451018-Ditylum_brightwellii.AAC.1
MAVEMGEYRLLGTSTQVMSQALRAPVTSQDLQGLMMSALAMSSVPVTSPNANGDWHLRKEALAPPQVGTMANLAPSVKDITKFFPKTFIPKIAGEPNYNSLYEVHRLLMENVVLIKTTIRGGLHSHPGLVITPELYLQLTGNVFVPPPNPGPTPIMPTPYMV